MFYDLPLLPAEVSRVEAAIKARNLNIFNETAALLAAVENESTTNPLEETAREGRRLYLNRRLAAMDSAGMVSWN
jgi:hypothetical protein